MFGVKGFDIVIGNPPYGTVYNKTVKPIYEKLYPSFKRNNDIYVAFFENANKLLLNSGILIFITPNTFLNGDYFEGLRSYITNHFQINEIIDFKNSKIFSDPTVYVSITSISKIEISYPYTFSYKLSDAKFKNIKRSGIDIASASSSPLKPIKAGVLKVSVDESNLLDHYFFVKDVGFNYWSIGKGKKRDGDSIGNRILYSGKHFGDSAEIDHLIPV
jgi:adenine-specific DNA-methyltransferase